MAQVAGLKPQAQVGLDNPQSQHNKTRIHIASRHGTGLSNVWPNKSVPSSRSHYRIFPPCLLKRPTGLALSQPGILTTDPNTQLCV